MSGIRTPTLAAIYARQGHLEEAARLYEELLAEHPHDPELRQRLTEVRRRLAGGGPSTRHQRRRERLRTLLERIRVRRRSDDGS